MQSSNKTSSPIVINEKDDIKKEEDIKVREEPSSNVIICIKRKREEPPLEEFYMEQAPKRVKVKHVMDELTQMIKQTQLDAFPLKKFSFLDSNSENDVNKLKDQLEKRKMLKDDNLGSVSKMKRIQNFKDNVKQVRFKVLEKQRLNNKTRLVHVDLQVDTQQGNVASERRKSIIEAEENETENLPYPFNQHHSILKQNLTMEEYDDLLQSGQENHDDNEYVYDYYYMNDYDAEYGSEKQKIIAQVEAYDQDSLWYDDEFVIEEEQEEDGYESEDSNDEDHPYNDYPDEDECLFDSEEQMDDGSYGSDYSDY